MIVFAQIVIFPKIDFVPNSFLKENVGVLPVIG